MLAKVRRWHLERSTDNIQMAVEAPLCQEYVAVLSNWGPHCFAFWVPREAMLCAVKSASLPTWSSGGLGLQSLHGMLIQSFTRAFEDNIQRALGVWGPFLQTFSGGVRNSCLRVRISAVFLMILAICDYCHLFFSNSKPSYTTNMEKHPFTEGSSISLGTSRSHWLPSSAVCVTPHFLWKFSEAVEAMKRGRTPALLVFSYKTQ